MSIDYKQLQALVKEAMFTSGGINEPSAPEGIPHRMPAGDSGDRQQDMGDPKANKLYALAGVGFGGGLEEMVTGQESSQAKSLLADFNKMTPEQQTELISMLPTPDEKGTP